MNKVWQLFLRREFLLAVGLIFLIKLIWLLGTTPLYDLDTNSYIRGGLDWDIYHNPFMNIFIAVTAKIWANAWFIIALQSLLYAFCGAFLAVVLFGPMEKMAWFLGFVMVIGLEPVTSFYNMSLLAESSFTGFLCVIVGAAVLWLREPDWRSALLFGGGFALLFLCKLSALIMLPLFGIFLLRGPFWRRSVRDGMIAAVPFVLAYVGVFVGQKAMNGGDLYTVEGRVRWDFSSALYDPDEVEGEEFKRLVHPYILTDGTLEEHRERRRELSYLGYKDCVAEYEYSGAGVNRGVNACDSLFGTVAAQIIEQHFWAAEKQFIKDNFRFIHSLNYLETRFTPDLHFYYSEREWGYLDSLMMEHYELDLSESRHRIPQVWTSLSFGNIYMPLLWWLGWLVLFGMLVCFLINRGRSEFLILGVTIFIPWIFHLVYISYRPRFLAPYLILVLAAAMLLVAIGKRRLL